MSDTQQFARAMVAAVNVAHALEDAFHALGRAFGYSIPTRAEIAQ